MDESNPIPTSNARSTCEQLWIGAAAAIALLCMTALLVWSANDASFRTAAWAAKVNISIEKIVTANPAIDELLGISKAMKAEMNRWDRLGKRVAALYALNIVGLAATIFVIVQSVRRLSWQRTLLCALIVAAWVAFLLTRTTVDQLRTQRQVTAILPQFEATAAHLRLFWPVDSQRIPPGFDIVVSAEKIPDVLILPGALGYPIQEDFGYLIQRSSGGVIRFDLRGASDYRVEFHPNGSQPSAYISGFGKPSPPVAWVKEMKPGWFLVRYGDS